MSEDADEPDKAREAYQAQSRATRVATRAAQEQARQEQELCQAQAALVRARRDRQRVPVDTITWCGATLRVINRRDAHRIVGKLRTIDRSPAYRVLKDADLFPDHPDALGCAVFLLAEEPVSVAHLTLRSRIEEYPELLILGLICCGDLDATHYIESGASGDEHMPALIVLGRTRAPLVLLARNFDKEDGLLNEQHYLGGGLDCELLAIYPYFCNLHVFGPARIRGLVSGGGNVLFAQPPEIACHATSGYHRSRVIFPHEARYIFMPPTHRLSQVLEAPFFGPGNYFPYTSHAPAIQGDWRAAAARGEPILKPAADIAQAHAGFPAQLRAAFDYLFAKPHPAGPRPRYGDYTGCEITEDLIDGQQVRCRQIVRQLNHTEEVLLHAVQRLDNGDISLHLEHLTSPKRSRYLRTGTVDDDSPDMCIVKHGILDAIARLEKRYSAGGAA